VPSHLSRQAIVLVVDDVDAIRENLDELFSDEGYVCWGAATANDALARMEREPAAPDVILLDLWMPGMPVRQFISSVKERADWAGCRIVLTTAASEDVIPPDLPVDAVLLKPFTVPQLLQLVRDVVIPGAVPRGIMNARSRDSKVS
jgi:CheY-like chemotaxis protein